MGSRWVNIRRRGWTVLLVLMLTGGMAFGLVGVLSLVFMFEFQVAPRVNVQRDPFQWYVVRANGGQLEFTQHSYAPPGGAAPRRLGALEVTEGFRVRTWILYERGISRGGPWMALTLVAWLPFVVLTLPALLLLLISRWWGYWRWRPGLCRRCGYDLTGNVSGRCPECGTTIGRLGLVEAQSEVSGGRIDRTGH